MTYEWITDRLPTKADTDKGFLVKVPYMPGEVPHAGCYKHYSLIVPGQPWWSYEAAKWVEVKPEPAISFAVGQQWRRKDGKVVTVTEINIDISLPVSAGGYRYQANGTTCLNGSEYDLIELVSGPEPAPARTRKVDRLEAVGDHLCAICDDGTMWSLGHPGWTQLPAIPQTEA